MALSRECGLLIYEREGRGGRLTDEGLAAADLAERIVQAWEYGLLGIRTGSGLLPRKTVRIGAFPSALSSCVLPAAARLRDENIHIELLEVEPLSAASLIEHSHLDVALTLGEVLDGGLSTDPRLTKRVLWREPFVLVLPRQHTASAGQRGTSLRGYGGLPWVLPRQGSACDQLLGRHLARMGVRPLAVSRSDDWGILQRMAVAHNAMTLIPVSCTELEDAGLSAVEIAPEELPERTVVMLESLEAGGSRLLPSVRRELNQAARSLARRHPSISIPALDKEDSEIPIEH